MRSVFGGVAGGDHLSALMVSICLFKGHRVFNRLPGGAWIEGKIDDLVEAEQAFENRYRAAVHDNFIAFESLVRTMKMRIFMKMEHLFIIKDRFILLAPHDLAVELMAWCNRAQQVQRSTRRYAW